MANLNKTQQFFKSEASQAAFALMYLDCNLRSGILGIKPHYYHSCTKAEEWYDRIDNVLESGELEYDTLCRAKAELAKIYNRMVNSRGKN